MANSAEVLFKHRKKDIGKVKAFRLTDDQMIDLGKELLYGNNWKVPLPGPETHFVIESLESPLADHVIVNSDDGLNLSITSSGSKKRWELKIVPDHQQPQIPTTVNVSLGEDEPDNGG